MKKIKFEELVKVFKKYVDKDNNITQKSDVRFIYNDGKYLLGTNSHVALRVKLERVEGIPSDFTEGLQYCPFDKKVKNSGKYPNLNRLFDSALMNAEHVSFWKKRVLNELYECVKEDFRLIDKNSKLDERLIKLYIQEDYYEHRVIVKEKTINQTILKHRRASFDSDKQYTLHVKFNYYKDAIMNCKKLQIEKDYDVEMHITGHNRPILFKCDNIFDIMVLPTIIR